VQLRVSHHDNDYRRLAASAGHGQCIDWRVQRTSAVLLQCRCDKSSHSQWRVETLANDGMFRATPDSSCMTYIHCLLKQLLCIKVTDSKDRLDRSVWINAVFPR